MQRRAGVLLALLALAAGGTARAGELMGCPAARSEECPPYELLEAGVRARRRGPGPPPPPPRDAAGSRGD